MRFENWRDEELIRQAIADEIAAAEHRLEGLEKRVMKALATRDPSRSPWRRWLRSLIAPRSPALRLGYALAGALLFLGLGLLIGRFAFAPEPLPALAQEGTVFALAAPGAHKVEVVGDFSAWKPIPLADPDGDGVWTLILKLPPGRYEYAFLVDGRWVGQDPNADEYVRTMGDYTSVRYIGGDST
ncbi:MAG: hypothetical protein GXO72_04810 [Caldiserica bacterium]|nr:hypothetical protein [Caldisericota bacterium]